jgi:hypothetical protein
MHMCCDMMLTRTTVHGLFMNISNCPMGWASSFTPTEPSILVPGLRATKKQTSKAHGYGLMAHSMKVGTGQSVVLGALMRDLTLVICHFVFVFLMQLLLSSSSFSGTWLQGRKHGVGKQIYADETGATQSLIVQSNQS